MPLLIALLLAVPGWEGAIHFTHNPPRKSGGSEGAIHFAAGRVRVEEPTPWGLTVILWDGEKLRLLFPARKTFLELPPEQAPLATAPPLSLRGMSQSGTETVNGEACAIYEKKGPVTQRLWVPESAAKKKLFFFLREATISARGATLADVSGIRFADQPDSLFRVPKGYRLTSR